jgi:hypothetical protein
MAVGTAKQIATTSAHVGAGGHREREITYRVISDDVNDGSAAVQGASGLPKIGDLYGEADLGVVCVALMPERVSRYVWHVAAIFSTEYESITQILNEPPDCEFTSEPGETPVLGVAAPTGPSSSQNDTDPNNTTRVFYLQGKGIVNSAGNIYDPPATRRIVTPIVRVTRNETATSFNLARKIKFENSVNLNSWNGLVARQAFCRLYSAQAMYFTPPTYTLQRTLYWRVTYEFALKFETWDLVLLDAGPYYLSYSGATAYRKPFLTPEGTPYIGLLDHTTDSTKPGQKLAAGADAQYLRWRVNREEDFGLLNINLNLNLQDFMPRARGYRPFPDPSKTPISVA